MKWILSSCVFFFCIGLFLFFRSNEIENKLLVHFLDIGQGDAIFLDYQGFQILVDGGPDNRIIEQLRQTMPIGDNTIDWVILSHPDADHLGGLLDVINSYQVDKVIMPKISKDTSLYEAWESILVKKEISIFYIEQQEEITLTEDYHIRFLHPTPNTIEKHFAPNNYSLVTHILFGEIDLLLTGDIEAEVEELLVKEYKELDIELLKSPHHGSKSSSTPEFLEMLSPELVVIQSGKDNKFGHPHNRVLFRYEQIGAQVFRNDQEGDLRFAFFSNKIDRLTPRIGIFPQLFGFASETMYNVGI